MVSKFFQNLRNSEKGVSLIELVVVVVIITMFSLIMVADFPRIQRQFALLRIGYQVEKDLRRTEDLGLSGVKTYNRDGLPVAVKGYGVYFNLFPLYGSKTKYLIYADVASPGPGNNFNQKYDGDFSTPLCTSLPDPVVTDCVIEVIDISKENSSLKINSIAGDTGTLIGKDIPAGISVNFMPPNPIVSIKDSSDVSYYNAAIVLGLISDASAARTVLVNSSGLINVKQ